MSLQLGQLKSARENLDKAIHMEPDLVHGYWQRHLLFLLQGKKTEALEDLNHILKINRLHAGAYISRYERGVKRLRSEGGLNEHKLRHMTFCKIGCCK